MTERLINSLVSPSGVPDMRLDGSVTDSQTTITVDVVPANVTDPNFRIRIDDEICLVTALDGLDLTVTRAVEDAGSMPAASHTAGSAVFIVPTAHSLDQYLKEQGGVGGLLYLAAHYT